MTDETEPTLPPGCKWVKASNLKPGDKIVCDDGTVNRVARVGVAKWIKTPEGYCLEVFYGPRARFGEICGKSDEFAVKL